MSLEEIDFGEVDERPSVKTLILYNFSQNENCKFEFINNGFTLDDRLVMEPSNGELEPGKHLLIKLILYSNSLSSYNGELEINITWSLSDNFERLIKETKESKEKISRADGEKEKLFVRVLKKAKIKEVI